MLLVLLASIPGLAAAASPPPAAAAQAPVPELGVVECFRGPYFGALAKARAEGRMTLVVFWTADSPWCQKLVADTFEQESVAAALAEDVVVSVDMTRDGDGALLDQRSENVARRFAVPVFPSLFFLDSEGVVQDVVAGYIPPGPFLGELARVRAGQGTRSDLANAVARAPDDIAARLALARKLLDLGDAAGHDEQMAAVKELDPDEVSLPVREMKYGRVVEAAEARFDDDRGLYDVQPIIEFLRDEKHAAVLFQGWSYVADLNDRLGRDPEARRAYAQAWAYVPAAQVVRFGHDLAANFWRGRADLTDAERALALEAAERAAEASESAGLDAPSMARMRDVLACSYFLVGRRADALAAIEQSIALDPDNEAYALRREVFRLRK